MFIETYPNGKFVTSLSIMNSGDGIEIKNTHIESILLNTFDVYYASKESVKTLSELLLVDIWTNVIALVSILYRDIWMQE